jgi:hypothetical protein
MRAQLTVTVNTSKWLISQAIVSLPETQKAYRHGKIILKGGTTVSCIAEKLVGVKLKISGRITVRGTVSSFKDSDSPHSILIEKGKWENIDNCFTEKVLKMGPGDIIVLGANAIDSENNAAMMAGSPGGGNPGAAFTAFLTEGVGVIIAASLEKLVPGKISDLIKKAGRKKCDFAMGMSVGLMPIYGRIITEVDALKIISGAEVSVIGHGGINGGEGATTVLVEGNENSVKKAIKAVLANTETYISGNITSLEECKPGSSGCINHLSCFYANKNKLKIS